VESTAFYQAAVAVALGMTGQLVAARAAIPSIVVLLVIGVSFGPDALGVLQPAVFGAARTDLVSLAVTVILFEGGLALSTCRRKYCSVLPGARSPFGSLRVSGFGCCARRAEPLMLRFSKHERDTWQNLRNGGLRIEAIRGQQRSLLLLLTVGAAISMAVGSCAAHYMLGLRGISRLDEGGSRTRERGA
jgi:hypothetical protein